MLVESRVLWTIHTQVVNRLEDAARLTTVRLNPRLTKNVVGSKRIVKYHPLIPVLKRTNAPKRMVSTIRQEGNKRNTWGQILPGATDPASIAVIGN